MFCCYRIRVMIEFCYEIEGIKTKCCYEQRDLSTKSGVSFDTISRLENGKQTPNFVTIRKLAKALNVEPNSIDFK